MTSRERVLKTLNHEEPDKVPIDLGSMRSTGIMAIAYNRLKKYLNIEGGYTRVFDIGQQLAELEQEILDRFEVDIIDLSNSFGGKNTNWKDWTLPDGSLGQVHKIFYPVKKNDEWIILDNGIARARMPEKCLYFEPCNPPMENANSIKDIETHNWYLYSDEDLKLIEQKARQLNNETDYAIMGSFGGNILETGQGLRGWSKFMMDMVVNRNFAEDLMDKMVEIHLKNLEVFLQAVGDNIQIIQMGDDLGTQNSLQLSPDMYREMIKPRQKEVYQYVKQHSNLYVFLHSCGSIYDVIPDLIEIGVDILNPVQTSAVNMDPQKLKSKFGEKITFWGGGVDTQHILPDGTSDEIIEQVKERLKIFAPGGGFVFAPVHNIQANITPENIIAAYDTVRQFREYPLS